MCKPVVLLNQTSGKEHVKQLVYEENNYPGSQNYGFVMVCGPGYFI
jgi:hypothetical protein